MSHSSTPTIVFIPHTEGDYFIRGLLLPSPPERPQAPATYQIIPAPASTQAILSEQVDICFTQQFDPIAQTLANQHRARLIFLIDSAERNHYIYTDAAQRAQADAYASQLNTYLNTTGLSQYPSCAVVRNNSTKPLEFIKLAALHQQLQH